MALIVQLHSQRQATVLACKGTIVFGEESDFLRARVKEQLRLHSSDAPGPWLVLDLSEVRYVDSGGLGALVGVLTSTRAAGGDLRLAAPNERVSRVLKTTHLDRVFHIHPTAEEAVKAVDAAAAGAAD
jgi:anti-sigma B factor antagonist